MSNRTIKFREWDGFSMNYEPNISMVSTACINERFEDNDFMQFTGLIDKNGKEIYEGDIVRGYGTFMSVIVFENGYFSWDNPPICIDLDDPYEVYDTKDWAEVMGNIYENPDLLKDE